MAVHLGSDLPSEKPNTMFEALTSVASLILMNGENENPPNSPLEVRPPNTVKKPIKKSATSTLKFDDIRRMPAKLLIGKFSEMTSDELTKKYSYKCMLLPEDCTISFNSFGNEKKACDKMKSHLMCHIEQLTMEYEASERISETLFVPVSPNSTEKLSKKSVKKQQNTHDYSLPQTSSSKASKKVKKSPFTLKTEKKKLRRKKYDSELKIKGRNINSVYLEEDPIELFNGDNYVPNDGKYVLNKRTERNSEESDQECDSKHYNSYSKHLKIAIFTDEEVKEDLCESPSGSEQMSHLIDGDNFGAEKNKLSILASEIKGDISVVSQDHDYIDFAVTESDTVLSSECKHRPGKYEDPFLYQTTDELPPYVVKTPPFPFIHTPLLPEVAEIIEIRMEDSEGDVVDRRSHSVNHSWDANVLKSDEEEVVTDECMSDHEENYSDDVFCKINGTSSSVLECVENIENKKHSTSCVPKNELSANENDENLENQQKDEKELALKYIAKLHSKGKKKISDSLMCKICCPGKHFTAQATLMHHYRSHAGIKPYMCTLCSQKFTRQHSLNYHMLIHKNLSRFTCDFCGRTFRHPSHYKEHLRRHTGETPYHCTDCNLHFKTRNTFKRHLKTRHGKLLTAGGIEDLNAE